MEKYPVMPAQELEIDLKISPNYLTQELAQSLSVLEPYGAANNQAVFGVYKMELLSVTPLKEGLHIRMELEKKGRKIRVVKFKTPYDEFPYHPGDILNLAVVISNNFYRERHYLSIRAVDVRLADCDDDKYFSEKKYGNSSGWMYRVNGWYPNYSSSSYVLNDGDVIVWVFTKDGGSDIGQDPW